VRGPPADQPVETGEFDAFVGGLDYPVFVVTTAHEDARAGCLVGFTTQVSIDPPRFLVCLSVKNHTYNVARHAPALAVHVLASSQHELAELFGGTTGDEVDKFSRCRWRPGPGGVPLLEDCARRIVGRVLRQHVFGDHVGFLLDPTDIDVTSSGQDLTFRHAHDIEAGHPA
jgi:flavin reductase (DIM6/NTAB) family NADH-FMN oxidoreductase RutF